MKQIDETKLFIVSILTIKTILTINEYKNESYFCFKSFKTKMEELTNKLSNLSFKDKDLIVFDLNGTLLFREEFKPNKERLIIPRPHLYEFMDEIVKKYKIAIFTSCKENNGKMMINKLLKDYKFEFIWYRDHCILDPDYSTDCLIDNFIINKIINNKVHNYIVEEHDTIKNLSSILSSPIINQKRIYNKNNVLLIDDGERKMRFNPKNSYYIIPTYKGEDDDKELLKLLDNN